MRIGMIGLGRLGLPVAYAMASKGHEVCGYDPHPQTVGALAYEAGLTELARVHDIAVLPSIGDVLGRSDVVFIAVQTPHEPEFDGTSELTDRRADFEVGYLAQAFRTVAGEAGRQERRVVVAVISTVLPGTWDRVIAPAINGWVDCAYTPSLIAMGTTIADWLRPEMVMLGTDNAQARERLTALHRTLHDRPILNMRPADAELTKMSYNSFIGLKIAFANWVMEICHHTGADVDVVTGALAQATDRIVSPRYMSAGMGDGGGCHPRDNIALSWLSKRLGLSCDVAGFTAEARQAQSRWLADLAIHWSKLTGLPIVLCGKEYKADSPLTAGSAALLLASQLEGRCIVLPHDGSPGEKPAVFVITTRHSRWPNLIWPQGSVVLDPWGYIPDETGLVVIRVGRKKDPPASMSVQLAPVEARPVSLAKDA